MNGSLKINGQPVKMIEDENGLAEAALESFLDILKNLENNDPSLQKQQAHRKYKNSCLTEAQKEKSFKALEKSVSE